MSEEREPRATMDLRTARRTRESKPALRVNRRVVGSRTICLMIQMSRAPWRHDRTGRLARRLHLVRRRRSDPSEELPHEHARH